MHYNFCYLKAKGLADFAELATLCLSIPAVTAVRSIYKLKTGIINVHKVIAKHYNVELHYLCRLDIFVIFVTISILCYNISIDIC